MGNIITNLETYFCYGAEMFKEFQLLVILKYTFKSIIPDIFFSSIYEIAKTECDEKTGVHERHLVSVGGYFA